MSGTFYRRILPSPPAIDFSSSEGKRIFKEAIREGTMEMFCKIIPYFNTQSEPAFCGPGTLSCVLNTLAIDPKRKWKGNWRWFDDNMVATPEFLKTIETNGLTFDQFVNLARNNGAKVSPFRNGNIESFRQRIITCSSTVDSCMVISYNRKVFKQLGEGHFSPIGGYHGKGDWVLILDVARFKYPPHWVPLNLMWDAINTLDDATGLSRGYMILSRLDEEGQITSSS